MAWKNDQVSEEETEKIIKLAKSVLGVEGDFVEFGCYKGDTSLVLAELLHRDFMLHQKASYSSSTRAKETLSPPVENGVENHVDKVGKTCVKHVKNNGREKHLKRLWIYDSFEGLPEKNIADESVLGVDFREGELFVTKREVKERFLRAGLPVPVIKKAWFCDLSDGDLPEKIAFAFLDGDFYESIRDSLKLVGPRMSGGGVVIVHDYTNPALPGVKKAVDEWAKGRELGYKLVLL